MAEFLVKLADERGRLAQQVEQGYSESEVRERFVQQGYLVYWVKPRGLFVGGRKEWQHGRGARSLYRLPATGVDVQEEAGGFAGLSRAAGDGSAMHADVFDHLRSAPVCEAL